MSDARTTSDPKRYKPTLNLPSTPFPMKANLVQNEPASLERWSRLDVYGRLRERRAGRARFWFHDGPPYANGSLHLGHLMNKCLKDIVVRSRSMLGDDVPYVPGWDCHGLPIEHRVMSGLVESGGEKALSGLEPTARTMAIRRACQSHAEAAVALQSSQMRRMLTLGDYGSPYLTMSPSYESGVLEVLATLCERGLVRRALKPVHWSVANETALAEAELEYEDREDLSVYVDFEASDGAAVYAAFGLDEAACESLGLGQTPSLMIWTTTPWTLPANLAIAVNPSVEYSLVRMDGNVTVVASRLVEGVARLGGVESPEVLARAEGSALVGLGYRHPFNASAPVGADEAGRCYRVVGADYVTLEDGTGLVHTAPGHGTEDYQTGLREGIPVYCPVRGDGTYDGTVAEWLRGLGIWEANGLIASALERSGHLFHRHTFVHSYPHDWRSKTPVIFRCTEQWFVRVDEGFTASEGDGGGSLRERALGSIGAEGHEGAASGEPVRFVPPWGRNRLRGMLESRPDWCISRQRAWGLPIPAFEMEDGTVFMTAASVRAVASVVGERGSDAWFELSPSELLASYDPERDPGAPAGLSRAGLSGLRKGGDILDVWFESGSSWHAVMRQRFGGSACPVELYLEGSDQHRGWFQLSLLPALGVTGAAPYRAVLTHGFMVDKDGRKLSKSRGNSLEDLFERYGADVLRWWVSSLAYEGDVKVDDEFFRLAGESYRKVRNTLRFMLSAVSDASLPGPTEEVGSWASALGSMGPTTPEAWLLGELDGLRASVVGAYDRYDFRAAHQALYDFCNDTLSAVYLAAVKDRLYCDRVDSPRRRRAQAALALVTDQLCRLLAPILCHTSDEAFATLGGEGSCVHLEEIRPAYGVSCDAAWAEAMRWRSEALRMLEEARRDPSVKLDNALDAGLVCGEPSLRGLDPVDLADLCGVSHVSFGGATAVEDRRAFARCERSWRRDGTVRERSDGGLLSDRDAEAVGVS